MILYFNFVSFYRHTHYLENRNLNCVYKGTYYKFCFAPAKNSLWHDIFKARH